MAIIGSVEEFGREIWSVCASAWPLRRKGGSPCALQRTRTAWQHADSRRELIRRPPRHVPTQPLIARARTRGEELEFACAGHPWQASACQRFYIENNESDPRD
jgi:hypothetical protein